MTQSNKPVKKFRVGRIQLAVWSQERQNERGVYTSFSITVQKSVNKNGEWSETNILFTNEIPIVIMLLRCAYEWILLYSGFSGEREE